MSSVKLKPFPGFVVKSTSLQDVSNSIPKGLKIFVNIAWDPNVPPPPDGSEEVIQNAMRGEVEGWYVPTVVSQGRQDKDKAGKLSLVFDAVFNSSLKSRTLTDPQFKTFLIELAFQRIEAQTSGSILLSRQIGTPNIASKGKLEPRTVHIPSVLYPEGHPNRSLDAGKLIEEVGTKGKGILKTPARITTEETPSWTWTKTSTKVKIVIQVPKLTHAHVPTSTLDLEPRRIILSVPPLYTLDVNLDASDAELVAAFSRDGDDGGAESALTLKRVRDLDVGEARAEWRVGEGVIVVYA